MHRLLHFRCTRMLLRPLCMQGICPGMGGAECWQLDASSASKGILEECLAACACAGPLAPLYYSGQFVPLIVFFLLFLSIVKNNKLHHFVRFHTMQVSAPTLPMSTKGFARL